ncbi:MAG: hypothetical protein CL489_02380 [Acidobacteria bacterium]|nr:hypothetical protein [Acidobacteriota bacterium]|tara:strand:+ start:3967 stop:4194 length:228 start_codon:yes stop_codon:yes gene_type:complete
MKGIKGILDKDGAVRGIVEPAMEHYKSFCSRMWLDYCDENNTLVSECLSLKEYETEYADWLWEQFKERNGVVSNY